MNRKKGSAFQIFLTQREVYCQPQAAHESLDFYYIYVYILLPVIVSSFSLHAWPSIFPFLMRYLLWYPFLTKTFHNKNNAISLFIQADKKSSQLHLAMGPRSLTYKPHNLHQHTWLYTEEENSHLNARQDVWIFTDFYFNSVNLLRTLWFPVLDQLSVSSKFYLL